MPNVNWEEAARLSTDKGWSNYRIADHFGVNESTIRRGLKQQVQIDDLAFGGMDVVLDVPLEHYGNLAVTADWHIPLYDPEYVNTFLTDAKERGHTHLVIAGDFFNFDSLSSYDPKQVDAGLEVELAEAKKVMRVLLDQFDTVYYIWGNHDARLHKTLGFKIQFKEAMRLVFGDLGRELLSKIRFTNLDHMWVRTPDGMPDWYICHPANYTRMALNTAKVLASKYNANVITAHSHHCAVGYGVDGEKVVAEIGGLFDRHKTAYLQRSTTFPTWAQGYAFIENGRLIVQSPGWQV